METNKFSEIQIEDQIFEHLKNRYPKIKRQVRLHRKKVDVAYQTPRKKVIGVEIKISNWRGALRQAWINKLACHESYVALWHEYVHRVDHDLFETAGIGLFVIDADFTLKRIIPASKKHEIHPQIHGVFAKEIVT